MANVGESDGPEDEERVDVIAFDGPEDEDRGPRPRAEVDDVGNVGVDGPEDEEQVNVIAFDGPENED